MPYYVTGRLDSSTIKVLRISTVLLPHGLFVNITHTENKVCEYFSELQVCEMLRKKNKYLFKIHKPSTVCQKVCWSSLQQGKMFCVSKITVIRFVS